MSWANNVLPRFIGVSGENKARRLPHRQFVVQIGDTKKSSKCRSSSWFQAHGYRFNRTLLEENNFACLIAALNNDPSEALSYTPNGLFIFEYAYKENLQCAPLLMLYGLQQVLEIGYETPDGLIFDDRSALSLAAEYGFDGICRALLALGANPNGGSCGAIQMEAPLVAAARARRVSTCKLLVAHGAALEPIQQLDDNGLKRWFSQNVKSVSCVVCTFPDDDLPF